jgi:hypothetical protein
MVLDSMKHSLPMHVYQYYQLYQVFQVVVVVVPAVELHLQVLHLQLLLASFDVTAG